MNDKIYEFIGNLAIALYSKKITISLSALNQVLSDNRLESYGSNRGLAAGVSAAYRYWEKTDPVVHHAIAYTYRDQDGNLAWEK
jgi:hypothetical protein